jgi:Holliday junction resolvase
MQSKLIKHWEKKGYHVLNLVRLSKGGYPDLIAIKPNEVIFIESKEVWDRLSPLQKIKIKMLKQLGFKVYVNYEEV